MLIPLFTAFFITLLATPVCLIFIKKLGLFDDPKTHKHPAIIHKKPIPRGGGIPLFIGIFFAALLFLPISKITIAIFSASFLALLIGVLDDKFDLSPYLRFPVNILCGLIIVGSGIGIPFITSPMGGILHFDALKLSFSLFGSPLSLVISDFIALVWLVWIMNMLNWSKGVDGQMPGIVAISAIVIGILSLRFPISDTNSLIAAKLSFIIAGSSLGFLIFNFYPAKIFPGYGATAVYLLLGTVSILSGAKLATAILVMGVPMVDGIFTIVRRIANKRSPFRHDNKHLHHLLLRLGLNQRLIALFYWSFSAILGAISLTLTSSGKIFAIIMLIVLLGGALLSLHLVLESNEKEVV
ncbi:undecaprenyl/decaprenyl-phosphate alpha-N-acetylglucosaminyl 1-phosphate transferase [Candidatus Microgenomates bacterium]|nr:MAG: undecaprenyl/decaprenyl-phosphate alpha-N-acetylglucosaminyl 1-phosphate transferase [Candidatus Microgenomates bacterium]